MNKMINCKTCGAEIAASAKRCPSCGAKNKKPVFKRAWFWLLVVLAIIVIAIICGVAGSGGTGGVASNETAPPANNAVSSNSSAFSGDCGIMATAEMGSSVIGYPELTISITNATDKEISAIKFYAVPYDVYGDEITGWTSQNALYTDTAIGAGKSNSISYQFIEDSVKTVKLYVYSVYFADGTQWGNKDAAKSVILSSGMSIEVSGQS